MSKILDHKNKKKTGLGRALGSLLGENTKERAFTNNIDFEEVELPEVSSEEIEDAIIESTSTKISTQPTIKDEDRIFNMDIEKVIANKSQPRKLFDEKKLAELSLSIKEIGVLQPIIVRKIEEGSYEIIAGERRWRASQRAGKKQIPVIVREFENKEVLEVALIENIQRNDLNPVEEAEALKQLIQKYGMTQQQLSERLGKDRASIANLLRLLSLSPKTKELVYRGELSFGQAKVILGVSDWTEQEKLAKYAITKGMSVREIEKQVKKIKNGAKSTVEEDPSEKLNQQLIKGLGEEIQKLLGQKVIIEYNKGKGKLKINFHSDEELNEVVNKIRTSWKQE